MKMSSQTKSHCNLSDSIIPNDRLAGAFTGWGTHRIITLFIDEEKRVSVISDSDGNSCERMNIQSKSVFVEKPKAKLSLLSSISIAGCDLLGSCLYTAGVCAANGGKVRIL